MVETSTKSFANISQLSSVLSIITGSFGSLERYSGKSLRQMLNKRVLSVLPFIPLVLEDLGVSWVRDVLGANAPPEIWEFPFF